MKTLKSYFVKKWLLCVPPMLALCLIIACSDDDKKDPITPDALAIESFSPPKGEVGTEITVIGTGFSTVSSENTVTLGTTPVSLNMVEAGKLKFNVPEGASSGKINVSVGTESVTSSATFTVEDPQPEMTITGIDPMEGEWDTYVVIDGNNFAPANNVVLFNGVMAEVFQESTSQITVTVPEDSRSGKIEVRDPIDDRSALTAEDFTVFHGRWTQIADFGGGARVNAMTFTLNNSGLVGLGVDSEFVHKADFWRYSPESDNWNKEDNDYGGTPRYSALGFVIGEDAYIGLGASFGIEHSDFWKYNSGNWTLVESVENLERTNSVAFTIGNKGYLGTGDDKNNQNLKDFWGYDGTSWTELADFGGVARFSAVGFSIGNKGYVGTGSTGSEYLKDFWEYDYQDNAWTEKTGLSGTEGVARAEAVGFGISYYGYIGLGLAEDNTYLNDMWEFDPDNNKWIQVANFPGKARRSASVFVVGDKAYVGLGIDEEGSFLADFWVFDPGN